MGPRTSDGKKKPRDRKRAHGEPDGDAPSGEAVAPATESAAAHQGDTAAGERDHMLAGSAGGSTLVAKSEATHTDEGPGSATAQPEDAAADDSSTQDATTHDGPMPVSTATEDEPAEPDGPVAPAYRNRFANLASPEAGWAVPGVTGLDAGSGFSGESGDSESGGESGGADTDSAGDDDTVADDRGFGVSRATADPDRFLGYDAVVLLAEFDQLNERLATVVGCADAHACRRLVERLTPTVRKLEAMVGQAAGKTATGGGTDSCRHATPRVWLAYETRVTPTVAGSMLADQEFLDRQPEINTARAAGELSWQHITAFRTVLSAKPWREAPFAQVVDHFVTVAQCSDPTELRKALTTWAEALDDEVAPDRPDRAYADRALHLRQVGEIWDIRGTLPKLEGATLAGVLDEVIAAARRAGCTCGQDPCSCPDDATPRATKRADALTALAGWATAHRTCLADDPLLSAGGAQRSRPMIIVPLDRLAPHQIPATLREQLTANPVGARSGSGPHTCGPTSGSIGGGPHSGGQVHNNGSGGTSCGCGDSDFDSDTTHPHPHIDGSPTEGSHTGSSDSNGADSDSPPTAGRDPHHPNGVAPPVIGGAARLTARELNEGLNALGVSAVRWYAGSESGTLNRRDTEVELCDATVARIITDPQGYPLDVGHETRLINPGLRAALIARDGGCIVAGCTIPASWSDAHHVIPWSTDGETSLQNLALCCRRHHRAIHAGHWTITFTNGIPNAHPS